MGGRLDVSSEPGQGTTFTLRLPQTLAVTQAVFVKIGETTFAVPIASVRGACCMDRAPWQPGQSGSNPRWQEIRGKPNHPVHPGHHQPGLP